MTDRPARYFITLMKDGQRVAPDFEWCELPTPGLCFEASSIKYRVTEVCIGVPASGREPDGVECDVVEAYRWNKQRARWEAVVA